MSIRTEVIEFAKFNHFSAKPMSCVWFLLPRRVARTIATTFPSLDSSRIEAHAYLLYQVNAVKDGRLISLSVGGLNHGS